MLNKDKLFNIVLVTIVFTIFTIVYFNFSLFITPDGSGYYWYTTIFDGINPVSSWNVRRGPVFPLLLYCFKHLFGDTPTGILIGFYIFYLIMLIFAIKLIKDIFVCQKNLNKKIYWIIFILLFMFNTLIIGYSHTLLTEAISPSITILTCYFIYKWNNLNFNTSKSKLILYTLLFSFIAVFMYHLKEYTGIIFLMLIISSILSIIKYKNWTIFITKILTIIICIVMVMCSICVWNVFLKKNNVDIKQNEKGINFISNGIINGLNAFYERVPKNIYCDINYINNSNLTKSEKEIINNLNKSDTRWCDNIIIFNVYDRNNIIIDQTSIIYEKNLTISDVLNFWYKSTLKYPTLTMGSYFRNYMSIVDLYNTRLISDDLGYKPINKLNISASLENESIGLAIYNNNINKCWWSYYDNDNKFLNQEEINIMKKFEGKENHNEILGNLLYNISSIHQMLFRIVLFFSLPLSVYSFYKYLKLKYNKVYMISTVIFTTVFIYIISNVVFGTIIDRYAYTVYPLSLLGIMILLIPKSEKS